MKTTGTTKTTSISPVFFYRGHISLFAILSLLPPIYIPSIKHAGSAGSIGSRNRRVSYDI
jgi:hypothetical protein